MFSAVTGTGVATSGRGQMPQMVRVGRAHWRSHGANGQAGNGRPRLIKNSMPSSRACSINRGSLTHRKTRHRPAHQPPHLPQGPRGAPCLFSWGTLRARPLSAAPVCSGRPGLNIRGRRWAWAAHLMLKTSSLWVGEFGCWLLATSTNNTFYHLLCAGEGSEATCA